MARMTRDQIREIAHSAARFLDKTDDGSRVSKVIMRKHTTGYTVAVRYGDHPQEYYVGDYDNYPEAYSEMARLSVRYGVDAEIEGIG